MSSGPVNTLWARAVVDELTRAGVRDVVVAPGSRSTPLVMAFAAEESVRCRVHLDERSAAFFALGVGKATGRPAVVVTTSGTAAANVFPAVIEASQSEVPLLVLTADRPHHLRDSDANQAIDQIHLYGSHARAFFEIAPPRADAGALRHLRAVTCRAVAAARGAPAGPVHLNFPFEKPLGPADLPTGFTDEHPLAAQGRPEGAPFVEVAVARREAGPEAIEALVAELDTQRGVIVAGPSSSPRVGDAVRALARATGFPVLADPLSGARYGDPGGAHIVAAYDLFLRDPAIRERLAPSLVLRVGTSPTSASTQSWIEQHGDVPHTVVDGGRRWNDHSATATRYVSADAADTLATLAELASRSVDEEWSELWQRADAAAREALTAQAGVDQEGDIARVVTETLPEGANLVVSSSMPIRDLDAFGLPSSRALAIFGNRGASGIDGVVSTAFGIAASSEAPTVCLIGDVALFHDQNGLLWSRERDAAVVFVLIDNDGGGIFHMLPIADHEPHFTKYFATPHGLDFRHAAEMHGIDYSEATVDGLSQALSAAVSEARTRVLCLRSDRDVNTRRHREVADAVAGSVRAALG